MRTGSATRQRRGGGSCVFGQEAARTIAPILTAHTFTWSCKWLQIAARV